MEPSTGLCRLCGKPDVSLKDLTDDANINILELVQELIKIKITNQDTFPSKICVMCEDTIISFQMFILECRKTQEKFKQSFLVETDNIIVKIENPINNEIPEIKPEIPEVKDENPPEDFTCSLSEEESIFEISANEDSYLTEQCELEVSVKGKRKKLKQKMDDEDQMKLDEVLKQRKCKLKDFVKFKCHKCEKECLKWPSLQIHCWKMHNTTPLVYCLCGEAMSSKSVLYKHIGNHKEESKKMRMELNADNDDDDNEYSKLRVNDFVKFTCRECNKKCSSFYSLKRHFQLIHRKAPMVQCICGVLLKSKSSVYKHVGDHKNPKVITCDKCPKVTKSVQAMENHKMKHLPVTERVFKCKECDKVFTTKEGQKSHEKSHIPIEERKIYTCEICNLKFTTRSSLMGHKRVVHCKIKGYICDLCGYACGTGGELRQHRAIHSEDRPFVCTKCPKRFKTYSNLKTHMDIHEDTSYTCYVCNRVLNSRRTLRKHLLVHENVCKHVCSYCNKAFKRRQTLKVHLYTHTGDKPLTCKWCSEKFAYASTLRSHRLRCHPDKLMDKAQGQENTYMSNTNISSSQEGSVKQEVPIFTQAEVDAISKELLST